MSINTRMMQEVLAQPVWQGRLSAIDLRALTPLKEPFDETGIVHGTRV